MANAGRPCSSDDWRSENVQMSSEQKQVLQSAGLFDEELQLQGADTSWPAI